LQAKNSHYNFKYNVALAQIDEALEFDQENVHYLFLKSQTLFQISRYNESLEILFKVVNISDNDTLNTSYDNYIGMVYIEKGDYNKALEYYNKALNIQVSLLGNEDANIATSYKNIGAAYYRKGAFNKALEYHSKALYIREKILGKEMQLLQILISMWV
jgi:tetratricopeptide (TPR) repeat protein